MCGPRKLDSRQGVEVNIGSEDACRRLSFRSLVVMPSMAPEHMLTSIAGLASSDTHLQRFDDYQARQCVGAGFAHAISRHFS